MATSGSPVPPAGAPVRSRRSRQQRADDRRHRVTQGAILAISMHGIAAVTHRRVAAAAGVSLAATTYFYDTKSDIIADASRELLDRYIEAFRRFAERPRDENTPARFRDFVLRLIVNAAGKHRIETRAWCEIILEAARRPELRELARPWFAAIVSIWGDIAARYGTEDRDRATISAIDLVIGFLFLVAPLDPSPAEITALFNGGTPPPAPAADDPAPVGGAGRKAEETRERILTAAIELLVDGGTEALALRALSERTGLALAAPAYHFGSVSALLATAQRRLFEQAKQRYRAEREGLVYETLDVAALAALTAETFLREATEHRRRSLANYPVHIQSSRDPGLRPGLWAINAEQWRRWRQILAAAVPAAPSSAAWMMCTIFTGKLIRTLATGNDATLLAQARDEFGYELRALADGRHWAIAQ